MMSKKRTITLNFKTKNGGVIPAAFDVYDGKSAFDLWKELPGNANKTEVEYFQSLKGNRGDSIVDLKYSVTESEE